MLKVRVLGELAVEQDGRKVALPPSKKTRALLAYLVVTGRPHRRDRLCELLWDIPDDPRGALRWSLSKLRRLLDSPAGERIVADRDTASFRRDGVVCDLVMVRDGVGRDPAGAPMQVLADAAESFTGEFLEGLNLTDCHKFHAWCVAEREDARTLHAKILAALIERLAERPEQALHHARALVGIDAGGERSWATLVRLLAASGRRREAEETYLAAEQALDNLGASRSGELLTLRRRLYERPAAPSAPAIATVQDATPTELSPAPPDIAGPERKQVTLLSVIFSRASKLDVDADPEASLGNLDAATAVIAEAAGPLDGLVVARGADGALAVFGAPLAREDHAERACHAAIAVAAVADGSMNQSSLRIAVHSGEAVVRAHPGSVWPYEVVGPVVQIARSVAEMAEPGVPTMTGETARRVEGQISARPLGAKTIADVNQPIELFALTGRASRTRWQARAARNLAAFVGRSGEMDMLTRAAAAARSGRGQVVAIVGEPGVGKSRLVHELLASPAAGDCLIIEAACSPSEQNVAFAPLGALLRAWLGVGRNDSRAEIVARLSRRLEYWGHGLRAAVAPLLAVLDLPVEDAEWRALGAAQRRQRVIDALKLVVMRASIERPAILLIEDAHWIDPATQIFLDSMVAAIHPARILLLVTYRPEYRHDWGNRPSYAQCRIDPLPAEPAFALLEHLIGAEPIFAGLKRSIVERTGGNPFFIEEIVRSLGESGALIAKAAGHGVVGEEAKTIVPPTVQDVLASRIDRLTAVDKRLLQAAAAIGRSMTYSLLAAVVGADEASLAASLERLEAAEFLFESRLFPERELSFKHSLTRQVAYNEMMQTQRRALHLAIAEAMRRSAADRVSEDVAALAEHYSAGEAWPQAADYLLRAARKAKVQYAYDSALKFAHRASAAAAAGAPSRRIESLLLEGDLLSLMGQLEPANDRYAAAAAFESDPTQKRRIANRRHSAHAIRRGDGRVVYYEHGGGDETLVFVHPFVYGLSTFQPIVEQLCQEFRVVTIDPRGTGASDPLPANYDIEEHMHDVAAVIESLAAGSVTAIGISRGANLLVRLAATSPGLLRRIVLVGAHTRQTVGIGIDPENSLSMDREELRQFTNALRRGDMRRAAAIFAAKIFNEPGIDELRNQFVQRCVDLPPETVVRFFTFDPKADMENLLDKIATPTLVMHGSRDDDVPLIGGIEIAQRIANAELYVFEGKGHMPMFTATNEFCDILSSFVRDGHLRRAAVI